MDRRHFLGLTGTSITALLGGCTTTGEGGGSDGDTGNGSTETYTDTPFQNETGTPTPVGTETPTITSTPTPTATPSATPEGRSDTVKQRMADDLDLSLKGVQYLFNEEIPADTYGLSLDQVEFILAGKEGQQLERAASLLDGGDYPGSMGQDFGQPPREYTDKAAQDLRRIFQRDIPQIAAKEDNDLTEEDGYNTVFPQSRTFAHRGIPSQSIVGVNQSKLSMTHPVDAIFNENRTGNTFEIFDYSNGDTGDLEVEESYIGQTWITTERGRGPGVSTTYDLCLWESVSIHHENASPAGIRGLNEFFGHNFQPVNQGERDNLLFQVTENGNKVLAHYGKPEMEDGTAAVIHQLPYMKLADAIDEQTEYDPYAEGGIPDDVGFKVGSESSRYQNFRIEASHPEEIDFEKRPKQIV